MKPTKKTKAKKSKSKPIPVAGLVLHTGYVESGVAGCLVMRSLVGTFPTLPEALEHLAHYLLDGLKENCGMSDDEETRQPLGHPERCRCHHCNREDYSLEEYQRSLSTLAAETADSWPLPPNVDKWWPWDGLQDVAKNGRLYAESQESLEHYLPMFLDIDKLLPGPFRKEVEAYQKNSIWINLGNTKHFHRLGK